MQEEEQAIIFDICPKGNVQKKVYFCELFTVFNTVLGSKETRTTDVQVSTVLHCKVDAVLLNAFIIHHQHLQGHLSATLEAIGKFASERLAPDTRVSLLHC